MFNVSFDSNNFTMNQENGNNDVGLIDVSGGNHISFTECTFIDNTFTNYGIIYDYGGIQQELDSLIEIHDSEFNGNQAAKGSIITIDYSNIIQSTYYGSSYMINNCILHDNIATESGGIIYANVNDVDYTKSITIKNSNDIKQNMAYQHGGCIYSKDLSINIESSDFQQNDATISGGAIAIMSDKCDESSAKLTISGSSSFTTYS